MAKLAALLLLICVISCNDRQDEQLMLAYKRVVTSPLFDGLRTEHSKLEMPHGCLVYDSLVPIRVTPAFVEELAHYRYPDSVQSNGKVRPTLWVRVVREEEERVAAGHILYSPTLTRFPDDKNPGMVMYFSRIDSNTVLVNVMSIIPGRESLEYGDMNRENSGVEFFFIFDEKNKIKVFQESSWTH